MALRRWPVSMVETLPTTHVSTLESWSRILGRRLHNHGAQAESMSSAPPIFQTEVLRKSSGASSGSFAPLKPIASGAEHYFPISAPLLASVLNNGKRASLCGSTQLLTNIRCTLSTRASPEMSLAERGLHTRAFWPLQSVFQSPSIVLHSRLLFSTTSKSLSSKRTAKSWTDRFFAKLTPTEVPPINIADWRIEMDTEEPMISTLKYLEKFTNHERKGVPKGAGTDSEEGFPLRRMELLVKTLGDPVSHLKAS
jgi:hypothetical protein